MYGMNSACTQRDWSKRLSLLPPPLRGEGWRGGTSHSDPVTTLPTGTTARQQSDTPSPEPSPTTSTPEQHQVHEETLDEPHEETHEQQHHNHEDTHESSAKPVKRSMKAEDDQEPVAHTGEDEARQVSLPMATQLPSRESQSRSGIAAIDAARLRVASGQQHPPRCPSARRTTQGRAGLPASLERKTGLGTFWGA